MIGIPQPLKRVFDVFPLRTYPPISPETTDSRKVIEAKRYYFEESNEEKITGDVLTVGVHNVIPIQNSKYTLMIPSDPISAGITLLLCHKNGLKLPRCQETAGSLKKSGHSILKMSYYASPDTELPIIIEERTNPKNTVIMSSLSIAGSITAKNGFEKDPLLDMLNSYMENNLYDLWILSLFDQMKCLDYNNYINEQFGFDCNDQESKIVNLLSEISLLESVPYWRSFKQKYPTIFSNQHSYSVLKSAINPSRRKCAEFLSGIDFSILEVVFSAKLKEFEKHLRLMIEYFTLEETNDRRFLVELKLVAFFLTVSSTLTESDRICDIIKRKDFSDYFKRCYILLDDF